MRKGRKERGLERKDRGFFFFEEEERDERERRWKERRGLDDVTGF